MQLPDTLRGIDDSKHAMSVLIAAAALAAAFLLRVDTHPHGFTVLPPLELERRFGTEAFYAGHEATIRAAQMPERRDAGAVDTPQPRQGGFVDERADQPPAAAPGYAHGGVTAGVEPPPHCAGASEGGCAVVHAEAEPEPVSLRLTARAGDGDGRELKPPAAILVEGPPTEAVECGGTAATRQGAGRHACAVGVLRCTVIRLSVAVHRPWLLAARRAIGSAILTAIPRVAANKPASCVLKQPKGVTPVQPRCSNGCHDVDAGAVQLALRRTKPPSAHG